MTDRPDDTPESLRALADRLETFGAWPASREDAADAIRRAADQFDAAIAQRDEARHVVSETLWMAGRYASGRQTYAVSMYNEARKLAEAGGYASTAGPAVDGREMASQLGEADQ